MPAWPRGKSWPRSTASSPNCGTTTRRRPSPPPGACSPPAPSGTTSSTRWPRSLLRSPCDLASLVQPRAQPGQRRGVGVLRRAAVADDQTRPIGADAGGPEAVQPLQRQALRGGPGDDLAFRADSGQFQDRVQAGRDPGDMPLLAAQGGGQAVAATAVGEAGAAGPAG